MYATFGFIANVPTYEHKVKLISFYITLLDSCFALYELRFLGNVFKAFDYVSFVCTSKEQSKSFSDEIRLFILVHSARR